MSTRQNKLLSKKEIESLMEGETESDSENCESKNVSLSEKIHEKSPDIFGCVDCDYITSNQDIWADHNCDEFKK